MRELIRDMDKRLKGMIEDAGRLDLKITQSNERNKMIAEIQKIPGIRPLNSSAMVATILDFKEFKSGRELAAYIGVVPRQHPSGGKQNLQGISKRGDGYLRTLLIHGTRAVICFAVSRQKKTPWHLSLIGRRNKNIAAVALAN